MDSLPSQFPVESCGECGTSLDLREVLPLTVVQCPGCGRALEVLRRFGPFELEGLLAQGGTGSVYKARDVILQRPVALKVLQPAWSSNAAVAAQFAQEAAMVAMINHPGVVRVYSEGIASGMLYIAMELADYGALDARMESLGRLPEREVLGIFRQAAEALAAAHQAGLIHRDVKPGNILFASDGRVKIVDFGLAMLGRQQGGEGGGGELWGTPFYIAPEMLAGQPMDFRADMYALGASMWHALVGEPPCPSQTTSVQELLDLKRRPMDVRRVLPGVHRLTAALLNRTVAFDPRARYGSYEELIEDISFALERGRRSGVGKVWVFGLAGVAVLGAAGYWGGGYWVEARKAPVTRGERVPPGDEERMQAAGDALLEGDAERCGKVLRLVSRTPGASPALQVWSRIGLAMVSGLRDQWSQAGDVFTELESLKGAVAPALHPVIEAALAAGPQRALPPAKSVSDGAEASGVQWIRETFSALHLLSKPEAAEAQEALQRAVDAGRIFAVPEAAELARAVSEVLREIREEATTAAGGSTAGGGGLKRFRPPGGGGTVGGRAGD